MPLMKMSDPIAAASAMNLAVKMGSVAVGIGLAFVSPVQPFLLAVFVLVVFDVATGMWAARKQGKTITSRDMGKTVPKLVLYPVAILLSEMMVRTFFADVMGLESLTYGVALFICSIEFQSNLENIGAVTGADIWKHAAQWFLNRKNK